MKRLLSAGAVAAAACVASPLLAQTVSPQCPPGSSATSEQRVSQDACQKAIDLFQYMAPQLGVAMTGGNATLGQGGTLGGLGHVLLTARANVLSGSIPKIDEVGVSASGAQQSTYPIKKQVLGLPQFDAAIGLFKGLPLGITNVGGVDLLVSAAYVPEVNADPVSIKVPDGSLKFGYGARIGLFQETLVFPGVSFTYLTRDLPKINLSAATSEGDTLRVRNLNVKTGAWRLVASKNLLLFNLSAGYGQDHYTSEADASAVVAARLTPFPTPATTSQPIALTQKMTRDNIFADVTVNLLVVKIIGEIGRVSGGTVNTYNQFDGTQADAARTYGAIGLRFGR